MTQEQADKIHHLLKLYSLDYRAVKRSELLEALDNLRVTSPKTGKPICSSTYIQYSEGRMLKELTKYDMCWWLNQFLENEPIIQPEPIRGFFTA